MSGYKTVQCRVAHRGQMFHFVTYEGHKANPAKDVDAEPPMWFLMTGGRRFAVVPETDGEQESDRDSRLTAWLDENVFKDRPRAVARPAPPVRGID